MKGKKKYVIVMLLALVWFYPCLIILEGQICNWFFSWVYVNLVKLNLNPLYSLVTIHYIWGPYCNVSKKSWLIWYSNLLYKINQAFLDI